MKSNKFLDFVAYARKFFVALTAALAVLATALADGTVNGTEWVQVAIAFLGALGVFAVANKPSSTSTPTTGGQL